MGVSGFGMFDVTNSADANAPMKSWGVEMLQMGTTLRAFLVVLAVACYKWCRCDAPLLVDLGLWLQSVPTLTRLL